MSRVTLIDYLKTQSQIYCKCPFCQEIFRLNEARLTFGKRARRDLLDRLREIREDFVSRLQEERHDASRAVSKGHMLESVCPYLPGFKYHPRDARFLGDPIDFVAFDGLFSSRKVRELTILEVKSGSSKMSETETSIKRAVEKGRVSFDLIQLK